MKPNFFIVGAAKSGTTSLANSLNMHPNVYIPKMKEPMYFIPDIGVKTIDDYLALYSSTKGAQAVGDASTGYLFDVDSPSKIYGFDKDARIIVVLRNPIDMMFSFWQYMTVSGNEQLGFIDALQDLERRKSDGFRKTCVGWYANYLYLDRARYANQIKRYFDIFPRNQIKLILFEEMVQSPREILADILGFISVDNNDVPSLLKANESGIPRSAFLKKLLDRRNSVVGKLIPMRYKTRLKQLMMKVNTSSKKRTISPQERLCAANLLDFDKVKLEMELLMGRQIDVWKV